MLKKVAIFSSGSGSNAENIVNYFKNHKNILITRIYTNKSDADVVERAQRLDMSVRIFTKEEFIDSTIILSELRDEQVDYIILSGFLMLIPEFIVQSFSQKIINIHPSLLPKYGGKGMYGMNVHKAVVCNQETESGITIHYIDQEYDRGETILQVKCPVYANDTPESLASRIQQLEFEYFPKTIEKVNSNS